MWLFWLIGALIVLAIGGGIFFGGVFTIILVPIAVIAVIGGVLYSVLGAAAQRRAGADPGADDRGPATRTSLRSGPSAPARPEQLADARRARQ